MRTWIKWAAGAGIVAAIVLLVPELVERAADRSARNRAEALPVELEWRNIEWFWTGTFRFTEVRGEFGPVSESAVDHLDVHLGLWSLVGGDPTIRGMSASGVRATVTRPRESSESGDGAAEAEGAGPTEGLRSRLSVIDHLRLDDAEIDVRRDGQTLATWSGGVALAADGSLSGEGELQIASGGSAVSWTLRGEADPSGPEAQGEIQLGPSGGSAENGETGEIRMPPLRAAADAAEFRLGAAADRGRAAVEFRNFTGSVGDGAPPGLRVSAPALGVELGDDRRLHVSGRGLGVQLAPDRLLDALRSRATADSGGSSDGTGDLRSSLRSYLVSNVDLDLTETSFELSVEGEEGRESFRPADQLTLRKRRRRVAAAGSFAGGWAAARASFEPGERLPTVASFQLKGVRLDEIPVVRAERSLPNRGVRGEVGGTFGIEGSLVRAGLPGTLLERVTGSVDIEWRNGTIRADGLAEKPLRDIDLSVALSAAWEPQLNRVRLRDSELRFGPVEVELAGSVVDWRLDPHVSFDARVSQIECQRAVRALPDTLLGPYDNVAIEGSAAPHFSVELPLDDPGELTIELDGFPGSCRPTALNTRKTGWPNIQFNPRAADSHPTPTAAASSVRQWAAAPDPDHPIEPPEDLEPIPSTWSANRPDDVFWLRRPFIMRVTEGVSEGADVRVGPGLPSYVPLQALPTYAAGAAYLSEEINFYNDGAWNLRLIQKGLQLDLQEERFVYGGSTVTQQLVKNLFLTRRKTLDRKIQEALIAWRMQGVVSKDRVLELYLNCIEYGEDVYGIGPAARRYFQKDASELTPLEAVFLAVIKPAPWYGDEFLEEGSTPESGWWHDRITEIMERLVQKGFISEKRAEEAKPYVLKWDDAGNYLPDEPASLEGGESEQTADEGEADGSE